MAFSLTNNSYISIWWRIPALFSASSPLVDAGKGVFVCLGPLCSPPFRPPSIGPIRPPVPDICTQSIASLEFSPVDSLVLRSYNEDKSIRHVHLAIPWVAAKGNRHDMNWDSVHREVENRVAAKLFSGFCENLDFLLTSQIRHVSILPGAESAAASSFAGGPFCSQWGHDQNPSGGSSKSWS